MRSSLACAAAVAVWLCAATAAAAPRVFVRGVHGPQGGEIRAAVASAIRGAVDLVGSARAADAVVDGKVSKKGLTWVLSVTVRSAGGKAIGGRSYPMPAPRVDRSTADKLRRDLPALAARAGKGAPARAAAPRKVAKRRAHARRGRHGTYHSAADEADAEDDEPRRVGRGAPDKADDSAPRPRRETARQRRARLRRERAERAAQAKREKAERARAAREARRHAAEDDDRRVRGMVRQTRDDEATDVLGPRGQRADARAARARQEQEERDREARRVAAANDRLARAQAEARRQREADIRRREDEANARRAEREEARRARDRREEDDRYSRRRGDDDDDRRDRRVARVDSDDDLRDRRRREDESRERRRREPEERTSRRASDAPAPPGRGPATLAVGMNFSNRHFELSPKGPDLPVYDAAFYPTISVEGEIYPLKLAKVRPVSGLGLWLRYDRVVGLTSQEPDPSTGSTVTFTNNSQRVEGGLVYRLQTGAAGIAPVVSPTVSFGYLSFSLQGNSTMPDTVYTYVALGLGFYVPIGHPRFGAISTVRYHIITSLGEVGGFGSSWTAWGVDLSIGLRVFILRSLALSASYLYERVEMTYQGLGPLSQDRGITPPSAGSDIYQGGRITLGYHF